MKIPKPIVILFFTLTALVTFVVIKTLVWPLISIYSNREISRNVSNIQPAIPIDNLAELIVERNTWEEFNFENFSLRLPEFEEVDSTDNQKTFLITDPSSNENMTLQISRDETDLENLDEVEPENLDAGYTLLSEYDALRIGPLEPPYDNVTYYILEKGYLYKIEVKFSTPVSFLDQILSSFRINLEEN